MPTGYTVHIENGNIVTGGDFLLKCASAFSVCIDLKENLDIEIPVELKPNIYHKEELKKAYSDLEKYKVMTLEEAQAILDEEYETHQQYCKDGIINNREIQERYSKVRKEINDWTPPTDEHIGLKKFALEQIDMTNDMNMEDYYYKELEKPKKDAQTYINDRIIWAVDNIKYHTKSWEEELRRTTERNNWINNLRESLN